MAKTNQSNLKLPELFANTAFRIPRYQRGYAWGEKQWTDLWDDIMEMDKNSDGEYHSHYTGTIALKEIPQKNISEEELWLKNNGTITKVERKIFKNYGKKLLDTSHKSYCRDFLSVA